MTDIEELIHHKMIALYRRTGLDADTILISEKIYRELEEEVKRFYQNTYSSIMVMDNNGVKFKGMDIFIQPRCEGDYIELLPLKQLKENNYV